MTPEAVSQILTQRADSLVHYLQTEALKITPMSCLARTVIGMIRKADGSQTLVVTLPGKPKAIFENLEILLRHGVLAHAVA